MLRIDLGAATPAQPSVTPGGGLGSPADHRQAGHVAEPVIADLAAWLSGRPEAGR